MTQHTVKVDGQDPTLTYAKKLILSIGSKRITTPVRALHLKRSPQCESRLIENTSIRGINEIYLKLTKEKIFDIDSNTDKLLEFGRNLRYVFEQEKVKNEFNLLLFGYENKENGAKNTLPTEKEIEYLCNIVSHPSSDVIIPPIIEGLKGDDYLEFLRKFFELLPSFKKNPILMGFFPFVATRDIRKIGSFYVENGINMFTVDYNGTNPLDFYPVLHEIHKFTKLLETEFKQDSYLHGFNVPATKVLPQTKIGSAKDILTFAMGIDSFGTNHKPSKMPPDVVEKLEKKKTTKPKTLVKPLPSNYRLFNRQDYGYYTYDDAKTVFKDDNLFEIKLADLMNTNYSFYQIDGIRKAYNVERHAKEATELQTQIKESHLKPYLESKKYGADGLRYIMKVVT